MAKTPWLYVPGVGVRDGLSIELFRKEEKSHQDQKYQQLISAVKSLGEKYEYDQTHAAIVTAYALKIFDALKDRRGLGSRERQLLEIAALLHDIGYFVGISRHHKHSYYLIAESDIVGLSPRDQLLVANIARYHRKSFPKEQHENFRILYPKERKIVTQLASIVRIADALDREHGKGQMPIEIDITGNKLVITLPPAEDRSFYRWTMSSKGDLFTDTYGYQLEIN
jgi:exopolyphosphatase/guanosine-5'-triphosphate,3'-diphosphate pyrophosphatase